MRNPFSLVLIVLLVLVVSPPSSAEDLAARGVFNKLSSLAGTWSGEAVGEGEAAEAEAEAQEEVVHEFRVSAAGTAVMETMNPGSDHEMINMYHLDGDDLVLTHYCAGGNQPTMKLDRERSSAEKLIFNFTGGTNLDPAVDEHIHSAEIMLVDDDHVRSAWTGYAGGEKAGVMTFNLSRSP